MKKIKKRIFEIIEISRDGDVPSRVFDIAIMALIFLNIVAVILETVQALSKSYGQFFHRFELISVIIFTIEYLLRIWTITHKPGYGHPVRGRIKFILSPFALVDLFAILPFYLPMLFKLDMRFIRAIRLLRLFRLLKMGRYSNSIQLLGSVIKGKKEELLITVFVVTLLLVLSSSLMYFFEHEVQPQHFSSIPASMWWGVAALTTVGYGDVYPVTQIGKFLAAFIAIIGIGVFALPTGILASGLVEEIHKKDKETKTLTCPHCGKNISEK